MLAVDIFFIVILGLAFIIGLRRGLLRIISSLVGVILGAWLSSHYYLLVFYWLVKQFGELRLINKIVIFIVLFFLLSNLIAWILTLISKLLETVTVIPLMKSANYLLGGVLNLAKSALAWSLIVLFLSRYLPATTPLGAQLSRSIIAPYLLMIGKVLWPLLPVVFKEMQALW